MPNTKFLEEYPLYRKFDFEISAVLMNFPEVNINMYCPNCKDVRTFRFTHKYLHQRKIGPISLRSPGQPILPKFIDENDIINLNYICALCEDFHRFFAIKIENIVKQKFSMGKVGEKFRVIEKVGQFPPWDIRIEKNLKKILGKYSDYYKKGKTIESQSYGIGSFAYYRRIVEEIIGDLLELIPDLMRGEELENYKEALEQVKKTKNTQDKIALVKDLLPQILMPEQYNPLKTLHEILSEGIHGKTDEECLDNAQLIRTSLIFLVNTILSQRKDQQEYSESMKKILNKRKKSLEPKNS